MIRPHRQSKTLMGILGLLVIILAACGSAVDNDSTTADEPATSSQNQAANQEVGETEDPVAESSESQDLLAHNADPIKIERDPDVPELPFADNPDPALCGIPEPWGSDEPAYLSGVYEGELIQPTVFLYDSHLRRSVKGKAPHGAEVKILLSQSNPELDYYLVKVVDSDEPIEGWLPAPFLSFEPPLPAEEFASVGD